MSTEFYDHSILKCRLTPCFIDPVFVLRAVARPSSIHVYRVNSRDCIKIYRRTREYDVRKNIDFLLYPLTKVYIRGNTIGKSDKRAERIMTCSFYPFADKMNNTSPVACTAQLLLKRQNNYPLKRFRLNQSIRKNMRLFSQKTIAKHIPVCI